MHVVIRRYRGQGSAELISTLEQRRADVEQVIRGVPGFIAYVLVRTQDGGMSITACQDRAGTEESTRRAAEWIRQNIRGTSVNPPEVIEGESIFDFMQQRPSG